MCGRYKIVTDARALYDAFQVQVELEGGELARYNVAPATPQLVIVDAGGKRAAGWYRWGLIPHWAKDAGIGAKTINARGDSAAAKPAYRAAFRRRRCLVPATGFYEWKAVTGGKQPYLIKPAGGGLLAFAGLWETWSGPEGEVKSFSIITIDASGLMARIHQRMPLIVAPELHTRWLDPALRDPAEIQALVDHPQPVELAALPVSRKVNDVRNQGAELIEPVGETLL